MILWFPVCGKEDDVDIAGVIEHAHVSNMGLEGQSRYVAVFGSVPVETTQNKMKTKLVIHGIDV